MTITPTAPAHYDLSASRVIAAGPDAVWSVLSDLDRWGDLSPENVRSTWIDATPGVGARFKGRNRISWASWTTVATVTAYEPGRTLAFEISPPSRTRWTYTLEPVEGGTRVTESLVKDDVEPAPIRLLQRLAGVRDRRADLQRGLETTLERLEQAVVRTG